MRIWISAAAVAVTLSACAPSYTGVEPFTSPKDSPESRVGERLFREPRFSQFFMRMSGGNPNARLAQGDPALSRVMTPRRGDVEGAFSSQAMSCVACHMVGDARFVRHGGMRGYADFGQRSPIPRIAADAFAMTPRNAPTLLDAFIERPDGVPYLLHYDGEFASTEDLVIGGYTGRNFGWRPDQQAEAMANIVRVIREDDGQSELALKFGRVSYRNLLSGEDPAISSDTRLARSLRRDITRSSDDEIIEMVKQFVTIYLNALQLSRDAGGIHNGSAYDKFLVENGLPTQPDKGESTSDYADRLSLLIQGLGNPSFIEGGDGEFGPQELVGLKIFLARSKASGGKNAGFSQAGNCIACHAPPHFTDFKFHNTGETQDEYDSIHGSGAFAGLEVPTFADRIAKPDTYFPATAAHPHAAGRFKSVPSADRPGYTDLGAWNILLNPDMPAPQAALQKLFCVNGSCDTAEKNDDALSLALASFKTSGLRALSLSDPYLHTGRKATIEDVLRFYQRMSMLKREDRLRNGDPELARIEIDSKGVNALAAFLRSLDEAYQ